MKSYLPKVDTTVYLQIDHWSKNIEYNQTDLKKVKKTKTEDEKYERLGTQVAQESETIKVLSYDPFEKKEKKRNCPEREKWEKKSR